MIGRVVSTKMKNTAVVLVERMAKHPLYKKTYIQSKRFLVDAPIEVKDGDMVEIVKVRPISRNKHWRIIKVVGKNLEEIMEEKLKAQAEEVIAEVMPEEKETEESSDVSRQTNEETNKREEKPKKGRKSLKADS